MNDSTNPRTRAGIVDVLKGGAVTAVLLFTSIFGIFAPAPAMYFHLKDGWKVSLAIVAVTAALMTALSPWAPLIYLLQAGIISLVLPELVLRGRGGARSIVYSVAVNLSFVVIAAGVYGLVTGANLQGEVVKLVQAYLAEMMTFYQKMGAKGDELNALQLRVQQTRDLLVTTYPALVTVTTGFIAGINLLVVARLAAKFGRPLQLGDFRRYRNPEPMIWVLIVAGFTLLAPQGIAYYAALNVLIVLATLYAVQGWAIISHFFNRFALPRYLRIIFGIMIMLQPFMLLIFVVLGIFDLWGDFRTPKNKENL